MKKEFRSASIGETTDKGIVTAYLTRWDTVDDYNSTFKRGAFKKSFDERGPKKIRLLWNHETLAGKVLSCREDDKGPLVQVQFNLETEAGKEAFSHVRSGDVDCFSFGFMVEKDSYKGGVRQIEEITLMEVGPVIFEANPNAEIVDVRSTDMTWDELIRLFAVKLAGDEPSPEQRLQLEKILTPEPPEAPERELLAGLDRMKGILG